MANVKIIIITVKGEESRSRGALGMGMPYP
jgi:hypothetical protein